MSADDTSSADSTKRPRHLPTAAQIVASRGRLKYSHENILFGMWVEAPRVAGRRPQSLESRTEMFPKLRGRHTAFSNGIGAVVPFFVPSVFVVLHASRLAAAFGDQFQKPKLRGIGGYA